MFVKNFCFYYNRVMKIEGNIEDIIFHNSDNGYTVLNIDNKGILTTCVGKIANPSEGTYLELDGEFVKNGKYGEQFAFSSARVSTPKSVEGIKRYLSSGLIKGIGPVTAEAIVEKFGEDTLEIIELNPEKLASVRGVSLNKAINIGESYNEIKNMQKVIMFLQDYNLTTNMSIKIYNTYGDKTIDIMSKNPYKLIEDIDGVGFLTADKIAVSMGLSIDSEFRVRAGILHCLKDTSEKGGNTYLPRDELFEMSNTLLRIESGFDILFDRALEGLTIDSVVKCFESRGKEIVMLTNFYKVEQAVAKKINLLNITNEVVDINIDSEIEDFERVNKITLHEEQKKAISMAVSKHISVITGGPGTGKTTIVKCILKILKQNSNKILLLAPTGRAAKRLSESCGENASTIHRALEVNFKDDNKSFFTYNASNKLPAEVVIVDEMSMVDVTLMNYLMQALSNNCKVVLVGDKDQLPSVGAGNVLHDILASEKVPYVQLTQIFRQDEKSLIVSNAHLINEGKMPNLTNKSTDFFFEERTDGFDMLNTVVDLVTERLPAYSKVDPINIQVLAPMKSGICGVNRLNAELQEKINPPSLRKNEIRLDVQIFREGDKVMQICNNYEREWARRGEDGFFVEGKGVFNGDMGRITKIDFQTGETTVYFDDDRIATYPRNEITDLQICYATTIHKSQGSEFDVVVMPIVSGAGSIVTRNLLYTGVTRAKKLVVLVGSKKNVARMVYNNFIANRYSMLCEFIKQQSKKLDILYN